MSLDKKDSPRPISPLLQETERLIGLRQLISLHNASVAIISELDPSAILYNVAKEITYLLGAVGCAISSWDKIKDQIVVLGDFGLRDWMEDIAIGEVYMAGDFPLTRHVLETAKTVQLNTSQPDADPAEVALLEEYQVNSLLMIPMVFQDEVIGLLEVFNEEVKTYSNEEILFAKLIANYTAISINNSRLFSTTKQSLEEQRALYESSYLIASSLDINTILSHIAEQICKLIGGTSAYISSFNLKTRTSQVAAEYFSPSASNKETESDLGFVYDHNLEQKSVVGLIIAGEPDVLQVDDPELDDTDRSHIRQYGGISCLRIPMRIGEDQALLLEVWEGRQKRDFTQSQIDLCKAFATHATVAIQNAQLYERTQQEIKRREALEQLLRHDAMHDALTDLPNRTLFSDRLERAIMRSRRNPAYGFAVLYIDLDRFKLVNDTYGHKEGDKLLVHVSRAIQNNVRELDTVSRFGGDEFLVLLEDVSNINEASLAANRILQAIREPITINGHPVVLTASIGMSIGPDANLAAEDYILQADIAMYQIKTHGKSEVALFDQSMRNIFSEHMALESDLRQSLDRNELVVHYQPVIGLALKRVVGFEALVRWQHPTSGLIGPYEFIKIAESSDLILRIGEFVLEESLKQMCAWEQAKVLSAHDYSIEVNISYAQLRSRGFVRTIETLLNKYDFPSSQLILEITENTFLEDEMTAASTIEQIKALGVKVYLDDFGTGYSSLSYIEKYPLDGIKIDRTFVQRLNRDRDKRGIVHHMVELASEMGLSVVAEGVETKSVVKRLTDIACEMAQGFVFSPGIPADQVPKFMRKFKY